MPRKYDFSGYATKNDLLCADGRIIRSGAFENADGCRVPLVWNHDHTGPDNVLGHADLEYRKDGVFAYCSLNHTPNGEAAREIVSHGDVAALSIFANQLKQNGNNVVHGVIREVSLVLAGANPGAVIETRTVAHGDSVEYYDDEATIYSGLDDGLEMQHSEDRSEKPDIQSVVNNVVSHAVDQGADEAANPEDDRTIQDIVDTMNDDQLLAMEALIGAALHGAQEGLDSDEEPEDEEVAQSAISDEDSVEYSDEEEGLMHRNVFENQGETNELQHDALTQEDVEAIFADARRIGSLHEAVVQHGFEDLAVMNDSPMPGYMTNQILAHGVENIDVLFPELHNVTPNPPTISRPMEWVSGVLGAVSKSPFNRIKSVAFDITAEEARAKGYIKGKQKQEEQIKALKRSTTPQTVYKLQKLDRDDVIDITDFDIVAYLKSEMRTMLDEELARAVLVGDGRSDVAEDKIKEDNIRPVWSDDEVYTIHHRYKDKPTDNQGYMDLIDNMIRAHKDYKGSGQPVLYIGTDLLTELRLLRDGDGYRRYKTDTELAADLRVSRIVEVQLLDGLKRKDNGKDVEFGALIVNLRDYTMGATRGGQVTLFDDFDLNYNKMEYLIETRCCGALTRPASAIAFEFGEASGD